MTNNRPTVSIILPVYKEPLSYFDKAYQSIVNQTYQSIEIIVIIDNPDLKEAIEYFSKAEIQYPHTRLVINEKNIGLIETLNKGLSLAAGRYIARMDSDDISLPTRIDEQLRFLELHSLDLVGGYAELIDQDSNSLGTWKMPLSKRGIHMLTKYHTPALHPTWLCKKDALVKVSGYRGIKHAEDHDLLARLLLAGFSIGNYPKVVIKYRINPQSISNLNSHWAYWGRIFVGSHFTLKSLNEVTQQQFEEFISTKLDQEKNDPRNYFHQLQKELLQLNLLASLKLIMKLMTKLPAICVRLKYKIFIKGVFFLDSTLFHKNQMR